MQISDHPDLSIIILNWNAATDTIRCVQDIAQWRNLQPLIWVIDNASDNDEAALIQGECPEVRLIANADNLGFSAGTNQGITASLALDDRPILLLNNDAQIAEEDVTTLLTTLRQSEEIGLTGPLLFDAEDGERLLSAGGKNPVLHHQTRQLTYDSGTNLQRVDNVSGTAVLIRAALFQKVGVLDEAYFFSTELADFCARARQVGYTSVINRQARAYHRVSRSAPYRNTLYVYYIVRNRFIYINKFYKSVPKIALRIFWSLYSVLLALKLFASQQQPTARAVFLGLMDGLRKRFGKQNERVLRICRSPQPQGNEAPETMGV